MPGLNWGAQEMPGCVTYRDELLPPRPACPRTSGCSAPRSIAHEMSHMWFGDLVTMTWWEDTWLQESFADYMGYRVADDAAGFAGALRRRTRSAASPAAYDADERRSTHPVAPEPEDVPDVDAAATIFDAISYAKGNSVLRQLVTWLGDETFLRGVNTHLTRHRFGNATLADFVDALDEASDRDVRDLGRRVAAHAPASTRSASRATATCRCCTATASRPHRVRVTAYDDAWRRSAPSSSTSPTSRCRCRTFAGRVVVPNAHGETFARIVLDDRSWAAVDAGLCRIEDDLVRARALDDAGRPGADPRPRRRRRSSTSLERHLPGERSATMRDRRR